jgi:hypothetical protein
MKQELPKDWRAFYDTVIEPGTAAFGLFDLQVRGIEPVLLIHATPTVTVPGHAALQTRLEIHSLPECTVVRVVSDIQQAGGPPELSPPTISIVDGRHQAFLIQVKEDEERRRTLTFETFLNPTDPEDRVILAKLVTAPALYVSMVQSGMMLWGKQFFWQEELRRAIKNVLEETKDATPVTIEAWQQAKERVMQRRPL